MADDPILTVRTPRERAAYLAGYAAAIKSAVAALSTVADATSRAALALKSEADTLVALADIDPPDGS